MYHWFDIAGNVSVLCCQTCRKPDQRRPADSRWHNGFQVPVFFLITTTLSRCFFLKKTYRFWAAYHGKDKNQTGRSGDVPHSHPTVLACYERRLWGRYLPYPSRNGSTSDKKRAICILVALKMFQAIKLIWILGKRQPEQLQNACMDGGGDYPTVSWESKVHCWFPNETANSIKLSSFTKLPDNLNKSKQVSKICLKSCKRCSDLKINSKSSPDLWHPRERRVESLSPTEGSLVDLLNCDRPAYNCSISYQQLIQQVPVQHI